MFEFVGSQIPDSFSTDLGELSPNLRSDMQCLLLDGNTGSVSYEYFFNSLGDGFFKREY